MREEKRREMSKREADEREEKRKPFSHIFLEIEKRTEKNALLFPLFGLQRERKPKEKYVILLICLHECKI